MVIQQDFLNFKIDSSLKTQANDAYQDVIAEKAAGRLPVLNLPSQPEKLHELEPVVSYFRDTFDTVVVFGTGGSSLGGQALVSLAQDAYGFQKKGPRLIFLDNIDPETLDRFISSTNFTKTGFIIISKSGNTAETICQLLTVLEVFGEKYSKLTIADHLLVITEPKNSTLTQLADQYEFSVLDHDPNIGGRFAALSLVGLLPAMIAGLDARSILKGAQDVLDNGQGNTAVEGAAWVMTHYQKGITLSVMMPYCDRLQIFCKWYRQLWAESLGKDGKGMTPIAAYGTVDQHSQLQLYLDGPKDKMFTILATHHTNQGPQLNTSIKEFHQHTIGDLMQAEQQATIETLVRNNCPTRVFDIADIDEQALGALMMHFILETMITAKLMKVNAFDQPAVEQGKLLAKQYLSGERAA